MTAVLVDTSVWRRYFSGSPGASALGDLLDEDAVLVHPFVLGELVLGGLSAREESLFARLGLRDGDDVERVKGTEVNDPAARLSFIERVGHEERVALEKGRAEGHRTLVYDLR